MLQILVMYPGHKEFKILKYFYNHTMWEGKPKAVKPFYGAFFMGLLIVYGSTAFKMFVILMV